MQSSKIIKVTGIHKDFVDNKERTRISMKDMSTGVCKIVDINPDIKLNVNTIHTIVEEHYGIVNKIECPKWLIV